MPDDSAEPITRLLFIYDAGAGPLAWIFDSLKKVAGEGCPLCALTHGLLNKREAFAAFESTVGVPIDYLHRNEAASDPRLRGFELPSILAEVEGSHEPVLLMGPREIVQLRETEDLMRQLESRARELGLEFPHR